MRSEYLLLFFELGKTVLQCIFLAFYVFKFALVSRDFLFQVRKLILKLGTLRSDFVGNVLSPRGVKIQKRYC